MLSIVALPVAAGMLSSDEPADSTIVVNASTQELMAANDYSDAGLAGTATGFLLVGAGSLMVSHRLRWRTTERPSAPQTHLHPRR